MLQDQPWIEETFAAQGVSEEDQHLLASILTILDEELLDDMHVLVVQPGLGWQFVVQNIKEKREMFAKGADENAWKNLARREADSLVLVGSEVKV